MNKKLLQMIILSDIPIINIIDVVGCTIQEFISKLENNQFNNEEIKILAEILRIKNPIEIFFGNDVAKMETNG